MQNIDSKTGCKAIMVGHSFGGRLLYATLARFGAEAADLPAATLYATAALHGSGNHITSRRNKSYVTCEPTAAFGKEGAGPWCSSSALRLNAVGSMHGDGWLTTYMQELTGPG
eukprot:jgi/Ulvmu1/1686/UM115_0015.1